MEPISIVGVLGLSLLAALVGELVRALVVYLEQPPASRALSFSLSNFLMLWAFAAVILAAPRLTLTIGA